MNGPMQKQMTGYRFEFDKNWQRFLLMLNEERIVESEKSLMLMLEVDNLREKSFLDIGAGSGLFSLAAKRLGARVFSFDFDTLSVACTKELKRHYFPEDQNWSVEQGNVLDTDYLTSLGKFDVVYAWGVLHHTGCMWKALENIAQLVREGGKLFISVYNDQGNASRRWTGIKVLYSKSKRPIKLIIVLGVGAYWEMRSALARLMQFKNPPPFKDRIRNKRERVMSVWHDLVDWVGGYPFEVAKPELIFDFLQESRICTHKIKNLWRWARVQ